MLPNIYVSIYVAICISLFKFDKIFYFIITIFYFKSFLLFLTNKHVCSKKYLQNKSLSNIKISNVLQYLKYLQIYTCSTKIYNQYQFVQSNHTFVKRQIHKVLIRGLLQQVESRIGCLYNLRKKNEHVMCKKFY